MSEALKKAIQTGEGIKDAVTDVVGEAIKKKYQEISAPPKKEEEPKEEE